MSLSCLLYDLHDVLVQDCEFAVDLLVFVVMSAVPMAKCDRMIDLVQKVRQAVVNVCRFADKVRTHHRWEAPPSTSFRGLCGSGRVHGEGSST